MNQNCNKKKEYHVIDHDVQDKKGKISFRLDNSTITLTSFSNGLYSMRNSKKIHSHWQWIISHNRERMTSVSSKQAQLPCYWIHYGFIPCSIKKLTWIFYYNHKSRKSYESISSFSVLSVLVHRTWERLKVISELKKKGIPGWIVSRFCYWFSWTWRCNLCAVKKVGSLCAVKKVGSPPSEHAPFDDKVHGYLWVNWHRHKPITKVWNFIVKTQPC